METAISAFVGLPWRDSTASDPGFQCRHLTAKVWGALCGIAFPTHDEAGPSLADRAEVDQLIQGAFSAWQPIELGDERRYDAIVIREGRFRHHLGMVVDRPLMLHLPKGKSSCIERYDSGLFSKRIVGFYRHETLR